jgi:hypothetical protein
VIESLNEFLNRIEQLRFFIDDADTINALVGTSVSGNEKGTAKTEILNHLFRLQSRQINRKIQTYVSGIILLYGLFEQYVEDVLISYLEELDSTISNFNDMPEKIRVNHINLSAQLLINRDLDKYRDRCSEVDIIRRMQLCTTDGPFQLNTLAFTDHKSNFRIATLNLFFEPAGISGLSSKIKHTQAFHKYSLEKFSNQSIDNIPDKVVFADLDDLAWRRNIVAHGWPDDTLSIELIKERIEFVSIIGESIYEVLRHCALPYIVKHRCCVLPKPIAVHNNSIACFHIESGSIVKGAKIIACKPNGDYLEGNIAEIEIDHIQQTEVIAPPAVDIACKLDFKAKDNYQYFLVEK